MRNRASVCAAWLVAIAMGIGCGGGGQAPAAAFDAGRDSVATDSGAGDSEVSVDASDDGATNCALTLQTSCTPPIDVTTAMHVAGSIATYDDACLRAPLQGGLAVVDSLGAFEAIFSADAGSQCPPVAPPAGTDFATQRVAVGIFDAADDTGSSVVLSADQRLCGSQRGPGLAAIALPISNEPIVIMTCRTTCSAPPGCPQPA